MPEKTGNGNDKWMDVHSEVSTSKGNIVSCPQLKLF